MNTGQAIRSATSPTEPVRQYGPSVWCRSQGRTYGVFSARCCSQTSAHAPAEESRSGGIALKATIMFVRTWVVVLAQETALVVAVVSVAVVGEIDGNDRGQVRRRKRGNLK